MTARRSSPSLKTAWFGRGGVASAGPVTGFAPEIAFSVEASVRRRGVGSILFRKLITVARAKGYKSLRITTGAQNEPMRALASKFGAQLVFRHGEFHRHHRPDETGSDGARVHLGGQHSTLNAARTVANMNRAYWRMLLRMYGWRRAA